MVRSLHHQGDPVFITALAVVLLFSLLFSKNNLAVGSGISRTYGSNSQFPFHSSSICSFHTSQNVLKRVEFFPCCLHKLDTSVRSGNFIFLSNLSHIFHWSCNLDHPLFHYFPVGEEGEELFGFGCFVLLFVCLFWDF